MEIYCTDCGRDFDFKGLILVVPCEGCGYCQDCCICLDELDIGDWMTYGELY